MKWFGLFALLFAALYTVSYGSSSVSAASVYDEYFTVADELKIVPAGEDVTENELCDFSHNWAGIFLHDDVHQDMKDKWAQRTGWSVSRLEGSVNTQLNGERYFGDIEVSFYIDDIQPKPGALWRDLSPSVSATWQNVYSVRYRTNTDCEMVLYSNYENPVPSNIPTLWMKYTNSSRYYSEPFLTYNMPVNYPTGFEGEEIPDTHAPPALDRTPAATVSVNDRDLTINFESAGGASDYVYRWALAKYVPSNGLDPLTLEDIEEGYNIAGDTHSTYLPHRGNFALSIIMCEADTDQSGDCSSMANTRATWLDIKADGSYFTASTGVDMSSEDLQDCITDDIGGVNTTRCRVQMAQDCDLEGADLIEKVGNFPSMLGCQMVNFFNGMRSLALFLAMPSSHKLNDVVTSFMDSLKVQLGFIWDSFDVLITNLGKVITAAGTGNCVLNFGSLNGEDVTLSMCDVRDAVGATGFDLALNLFRGAAAVSFVFVSFRFLQSFFAGKSEVTV